MKKIIISAVICGLFASCHSADKQTANKEVAVVEKNMQQEKLQSKQKIETADSSNIAAFTDLVPLALLLPEHSHVYSKYGIEFEGNCYNCDLAEVTLSASTLQWINVCDRNDLYAINAIKVTKSENQITIKTPETTFIFTKIDEAPVYELTIEGKNIELANKRIAKYFTPKAISSKFDVHDCGDFQG